MIYSEPVFLLKHSAPRSTATFQRSSYPSSYFRASEPSGTSAACWGGDAASACVPKAAFICLGLRTSSHQGSTALWQIPSIASSLSACLPVWTARRHPWVHGSRTSLCMMALWSPGCVLAHCFHTAWKTGWGAGFSDRLSKDKPVFMATLWYGIILPVEALTSCRRAAGGCMQRFIIPGCILGTWSVCSAARATCPQQWCCSVGRCLHPTLERKTPAGESIFIWEGHIQQWLYSYLPTKVVQVLRYLEVSTPLHKET